MRKESRNETIARVCNWRHVPLRNALPTDSHFLDNAAYGVAQEIEAAKKRIQLLEELQSEIHRAFDALG